MELCGQCLLVRSSTTDVPSGSCHRHIIGDLPRKLRRAIGLEEEMKSGGQHNPELVLLRAGHRLLPGEKWSWVGGYYGHYMVSSEGRLASKKYGTRTIILKTCPDKKGYHICRFSDWRGYKSFKFHVLVATAFCRGRKRGLQVNHKDGDKSNNKSSNLEWVTCAENIRHSHKMGLASYGSRHPMAKLSFKQVNEIRSSTESGPVLSRKYKVAVSTINRVKSGEVRKRG